jgi:hypothetical protein
MCYAMYHVCRMMTAVYILLMNASGRPLLDMTTPPRLTDVSVCDPQPSSPLLSSDLKQAARTWGVSSLDGTPCAGNENKCYMSFYSSVKGQKICKGEGVVH